MKKSLAICAIAVALGAVEAGAATLNLDSVDGVADSAGYLVGPYGGRLDNVSYQIFCDDFDHHIGVPDQETVDVSTIDDLSLTRFGGLSAATSLYEQVFYLSTYLPTASNTDRADIQDAMWGIFAGDAPNQGKTEVEGWRAQALANYAGKDYSNFRILTDQTDRANGKQELFISTLTPPPGLTGTPEPGTWAMLVSGVAGLAFARKRGKKTIAG